jgi:uncharacterized repeat protein (TIGR03803 family)
MSCIQLMKKSVVLAVVSVLFGLSAATLARAQTFSVVYNFGSQINDPLNPFYSGIIAQGRDGNLYSAAPGGTNDCGAFYLVTPSGVLTEPYAFCTTVTDGILPDGGLTLGTDGNLYGTTYTGVDAATYGTVFKITPGGNLTPLYTFTDGADGASPVAPPIEGTDENFYGTTCGLECNVGGDTSYGSIYKITSSGTFSVLYTCTATDCFGPAGPLIQATNGNFYGTSSYGGTNEDGSVFKITPTGKLTVLFNFDVTHGSHPFGGLVQGTDGNFYGTAVDGGTDGYGVIFRITPAGKLTVLHNMNLSTDGSAPFAGLVQATNGNFYGANSDGGANGDGTVFEIAPQGTKFVFSVVHNFDQTDGQTPYTTLVQHTNGLLYGTTQQGGSGGVDTHCGTNPVCGVLYSENIGVAPFAALVTGSGKVGAKIGILGQNFSHSSVVTFGTVAATTVTLSGTTFLTATVPSGATTGSVTVTTPGGALSSSKSFRVTPQLKSFTPPSGPVGTVVTITGVSLTQTTKVTFGGVAAMSFTVNSDTQVTATVPTGAKTGKIVITTPGGTASSATSFTVT